MNNKKQSHTYYALVRSYHISDPDVIATFDVLAPLELFLLAVPGKMMVNPDKLRLCLLSPSKS